MVICELCGSANSETDIECRVCGHPLPVTEHNAVAAAQTAKPVVSDFLPPPPADITAVPSHLQMSAFAQDVGTGAPPMFGAGADADSEPLPKDESVPSFLGSERRTQQPVAESAGLISANDLPEWIRRIGEEDAARAQADTAAQAAAVQQEHPVSIQRRNLPGETVGSGPTTNWLSKSADSEGSEHWSAAEAASANWGTFDPPVPVETSTYATPVPSTAYVPVAGDEAPPARKRRGLSNRGAKAETPNAGKTKAPKQPKAPASGEATPFYRNQIVQIAALVALLAIAAILLFG